MKRTEHSAQELCSCSIQQLADTLAIGAYAAEWLMEACQWDATAAAERGLKADQRLASGATRLLLDSQLGEPCRLLYT